jgi:hypothetical protein
VHARGSFFLLITIRPLPLIWGFHPHADEIFIVIIIIVFIIIIIIIFLKDWTY